MRENERRNGRPDELVRPRFAIYENVAGAFSSNNGKDWAAVLEETIRIVCKEAPNVPVPERGGWPYSGLLYGVGDNGIPFSVAWRLHDAQFWGVPQRRKRVALVADFGGMSAGQCLFGVEYRGEAQYADAFQTVGDTGRGRRTEVRTVSESGGGDTETGGSTGQGIAGDTEDRPGERGEPL